MLSTALAAAGFIPFLICSILFWSILRGHLDRDINDTAKAALRAIALQTSAQILETSRQLLPQLLINADAAASAADLRAQLRAAATPRPDFVWLAFLDRSGRVEAAYPDGAAAAGELYALRAEPSEGNVAFSAPITGGSDENAFLEVSYASGERTAVGRLDLSRLSSRLFLNALTPEDLLGVADASGRLILCSEPSRVARGALAPLPPEGDGPQATVYDGVSYYLSAAPVPGSPWLALYFRSRRVAEAPLRAYLASVVAMGAFGLALASAFAFLVWRRVAMPLSVLASRLQLMAAGRYSERVRGSFAMEFQEIADVFNDMAEAIEVRYEESRRLLREVHHRVKNNQQLVVSLLRMQADSETDPNVKRPLERARQRMFAMAMASDLMYRTEGYAAVKASDLAGSIIGELAAGAGLNDATVEIAVADSRLDFDAAVPFSLMFSEMAADIFDARAGEVRGPVRISLRESAPGGRFLLLELERSGPATRGAGPDREMRRTIAQALAAQLGGSAEWIEDGSGGLRIAAKIPLGGSDGGREPAAAAGAPS
jgi:two-component sensor histidine kinase